MSTAVRIILVVIVLAIVIAFALANTDRVHVDYLVAERNSRLIYVILVTAGLGAIVGAAARGRRKP